MRIDDAIEVKKPAPDSHFLLKNCGVCKSDNVAYVKYVDNGAELYRICCFDCGHTVKPANAVSAHAKRQAARPPVRETKFVYEHPDLVRRYIADGPCKGCKAESVCDIPCPTYLRWWDARMEIARKKMNYDTDKSV